MTDFTDFPDTLTPSPLADGLHTAKLPNGLRVIIKEDHRAPVAICNAWVKVGSNREPEKLRGWSHGIEHMLFKGTQRRREGDFASEVADAGGTTNAGTGYETTNYHITVPVEKLPVAVDILADVLFNSTIESTSLDAERKVLVHENHMYDDIPFGFGVTWRWGMELAFDKSPYRNPIGGKDENLLERDRKDILAFFGSAYRPDNMTVVIVGDVNPKVAFAEVVEKFGAASANGSGADPSVAIVDHPPTEPPHRGCRIRVEHGDIQRAYAKLIFPGPGDVDADRPTLSVARRVLSDGRSCRLYRRVQEEQKLVDEFTVMTETGPREGVFMVDLETDPQRLAKAIAAVAEVLADLAEEGCTEKELDRARIRVARSFLFGEETVQGQASTIGYYDAMGDLPGAFRFPERVEQVTAEAVAAFCGRTFDLDKLSCVIYLPEGTDAEAVGIPSTPESLAKLLGNKLTSGPGRKKATAPQAYPTRKTEKAPTSGDAIMGSASSTPAFETIPLSNGVKVLYRMDYTVPVVTLAMTARGGAISETAKDSGLACLMQMVQIKGADSLNAEAVHEILEGEGSSLVPRTDRDFTGLFFSGLSDRLERALDVAGRVITSPSFPEMEIEQERRLALEQLASLQDSPFQAATLKLRELVYGDHVYGRPMIGTTESLPSFDRKALITRYEKAWVPGNLHIVVSGSFDRDKLLGKLEEILADLPTGHDPAEISPSLPPITSPEGIRSERITREQNQSVVLVAWPGPATPNEDRVPLMLLKEILNGQSGRLFDSLRNKQSLCYNTGTMSTAGFGQGMFLGYVLTAPESEQQALGALIEVLQGLAAGPAELAEFERARAKLLGNLLISSQANSARVSRTDRDFIHGRGTNNLDKLLRHIETCQPEEVQTVAEKIFGREGRFQVILGP
ncbi:MAG: insulinase family protein [Gemmatimonadales bacterium]|nr:insulinase family protein [Gemmatimonadales bacterium]